MMLYHGGLGGAILEGLVAVSVAAIFLTVWLRERRARRSRNDDEA